MLDGPVMSNLSLEKKLSDRLRAGVECAPWVLEAVLKLERELDQAEALAVKYARAKAELDVIVNRTGDLLSRRTSLPPLEEVQTGLESRAWRLLKEFIDRAPPETTAFRVGDVVRVKDAWAERRVHNVIRKYEVDMSDGTGTVELHEDSLELVSRGDKNA
jgi:hypothetical protein